jgi:hypothetical protein
MEDRGSNRRSRFSREALAALAGLGALASPLSAEPVKQIDLYVLPIYESPTTQGGRPRVTVGKEFDALLSSNRPADILTARDKIQAAPASITPMTLMVLAIRLYDVGLRDESVFWFYAAKDRFATLAEVLEIYPTLSQAAEQMTSFAELAGPTINGYAFCDLKKQKTARFSAVDWVEKHPYQAVFMERFPAKPGDRAANLRAAVAKIRKGAAEEAVQIARSSAEFRKARRENGADEKYCWR